MTDPIKKRWAFLVGINKYDDPGYGDLEFCVKDVKTLGQLLQDDLGFDVTCIHDDPSDPRYKPIKNAIEAELELICNAVGPDDLLLVHFACHGIQLDNQPCLVTSEVRSRKLRKQVLPVSAVEDLMRGSGARCKVLLLDACHTGVNMGRDVADPEFMKHVYEQAEGFAFIAASTFQQKAYEIAGHGVFTHYLLSALCGEADGYMGAAAKKKKRFVSVQDVQAYVLHNLKLWNQKTGKVQTPTGRVEGFGDMILAYYPEQLKTSIAIADPTDEAMAGSVKERDQPVNQPVNQPLSALERLRLIETLNELSASQFEALVGALNPPKGMLPHVSAAQGVRSPALLHWVEGPTGPKLPELQAILEHVMSPSSEPQSISTPQPAEKRLQIPDELTLQQRNAFTDALMAAFPDQSKLNLMLNRELGIELNAIIQNAGDIEETTWEVVKWFERKGRLQDLLEGAVNRESGNPKLKALISKFQTNM